MKRFATLVGMLVLISGCVPAPKKSAPSDESALDIGADANLSLQEARKGFKTKITAPAVKHQPVPQPPAQIFELVRYQAPDGKHAAYLSPNPKDGKKHPAIIWITGGDCNSIDEGCWKEGPPKNDQSASAFRKSGIIMMFPSLRGGRGSGGGVTEGFFGEVDDILAAADYLGKKDYIDPARIYLGGHSTGGTLVFLTAEYSDRFRAVFSFGPVDDVAGYGGDYSPFDTRSRREFELRAPIRWLHSVKSPLFVIEGSGSPNAAPVQDMAKASKNPLAHFYVVKGANHFDVLYPSTKLIAAKIVEDNGPKCDIKLTEEELNKAFKR